MAYDVYFIEACVGFSGTDDWRTQEFQDAVVTLEGKNADREEYLAAMLKDVEKWGNSSKNRNHEIYETEGDISKFDPDLKEVISALQGNDNDSDSNRGNFVADTGATKGQKMTEKLQKVRGLYTHFLLHKSVYMNAFKHDNKTVKTVYVAGCWLIISYLAGCCVYAMGGRGKSDPDMKYGRMIDDIRKIIDHPKYVEYMGFAEKTAFNTESLLYEGAFAVGATLVSMIVALRLIVWNIYTMRTKISDKLRVTAEFLEKNAGRLKNTNKPNKEKIAARQLKASGLLNKVADKVRIKMDDDEPSSPPTPKRPSKPDTSSKAPEPEDDDDDDIQL